MKYLSVWEKLEILKKLFLNYKLVGLGSILIIIISILYFTKKMKKSKYILTLLISISSMFITCIICNYQALNTIFDDFMNIFFTNIYFPSIYFYIFILIFVFAAFLTSTLNKEIGKSSKIVNGIMLIVNNIFALIILYEIAKSKIDIFSPTSIYANINLVAVLELNSGIFVLWLLCLIVIYTSNVITKRIENKDNKVKDVSSLDEVKEIVTNIPNNQITFNDILNGTIPIVESATVVQNNDYSIMNPEEFYNNIYNSIQENKEMQRIEEESIVPLEVNLENENVKEVPLPNYNSAEINLNAIYLDCLKEAELEENIAKEEEVEIPKKRYDDFTIDQYKKFVTMLQQVKNNVSGNIVDFDKAMEINHQSKEYSYEDCLMFKRMLKTALK